MYDSNVALDHMQRCMLAAREDANSFLRVLILAIASIRIHSKTFWLNYLNEIWLEYSKEKTFDEVNDVIPFMPMKTKASAMNYIQENYYHMWQHMKSSSADEYHDYLCSLPGIGTVKAGFIVQMTYNELGCVDNVNLNRYADMGFDKFSTVPHIYRKQLDSLPENSQEMWANWCQWIADRGNAVSDKLNWSACGLSLAHTLFVERGSYDPKIVANYA